MYALDTNTLVYYFRGEGEVAERLLAVRPVDVGVPAVVFSELELGIARCDSPRRRRAQLSALIELVKLLPFGAAEARAAANVQRRLENDDGPYLGPLDVMTAGTALAAGATLVTHHTEQFRRIVGLKVVDWYE